MQRLKALAELAAAIKKWPKDYMGSGDVILNDDYGRHFTEAKKPGGWAQTTYRDHHEADAEFTTLVFGQVASRVCGTRISARGNFVPEVREANNQRVRWTSSIS